MARRAQVARGEYLPDLPEGIRRTAAHLASAFPGIRSPLSEAVAAGAPFGISGIDVWRAIDAVNSAEARSWRNRHGGPWCQGFEPWFTYDPRGGVLGAPDP